MKTKTNKVKNGGVNAAKRGGRRNTRDIDGFAYEEVFSGSGTARADRDGSIQGTAYLTYTVVPNSTYNVDACLDFCNSVNGCGEPLFPFPSSDLSLFFHPPTSTAHLPPLLHPVFANLYYELNNDLPESNLKCALYADVHTSLEKTNRGGQQLLPLPAGTTYIQNSSGFAATALVDPPSPEGYEEVFGPSGGANNAGGVRRSRSNSF